MIVRSLELEGFRNYDRLAAEFHPQVNLIYGDNAQGKTNLLEAIAYLSSARSHRARYDREMIGMDRTAAHIRGTIESRGRTFVVEAQLARGRTRKLFSNGVRLKNAGELAGVLNTVLFCPGPVSYPGGGRRPAAVSGQRHLSAPPPVRPSPGGIRPIV